MAGSILGAVASTVVGSVLGRSSRRAADKANNAAADATTLQAQIASDQYDRYVELYDPLERRVVDEAIGYDSAERYDRETGAASATVASQFGKARDRLNRTPGLDPSTPGYAAQLVGLDLAQAATDATQQNAARNRVADTAYARKFDALGLGKGLPASSSAMLSSAASGLRNQAQYGLDQANATSGAVGRVTDRVFSSPGVNNWLSNTFSGSSAPGGFGGGTPVLDQGFDPNMSF